MTSSLIRGVSALLISMLASTTALADTRTICIYDPLGKNGMAFKSADEMRIEVKAKYGLDLELKAHVEEKTASDDLVAGKCDGAVVTGVSARSFGLASSTLEAIGALATYPQLKKAIAYMADERMSKVMVNSAGTYETAGIYPAGAIYLYVRDKSWRTANALAGKKISMISGDRAAATMISEVGSSAMTASTATFGPMFNSHNVDACYAPATAFEPLELYRGLEANGGIIDFPLSQLTLQLVIKKDRFPEGFGQWGRSYAYSKFDSTKNTVAKAESKIDPHRLTIPDADKPGYEERFLQVRLKMRAAGVYDSTVLGLMRRVRCATDGTRAECVEKRE